MTIREQGARKVDRTRAGRLAWRAAAAFGVLVSAGIHLWLWFQGFDTISVIGPLFLLNAAGGLVIAVAVMVWRHWLPLLAAIGFGAATLIAFALSATVGLFGVHETWTGTDQVLGWLSELLAVVAGTVALWRERSARQP
jgi:hypothetical protein